MLDVIECCFAKQITQSDWQAKLKALMPAYGKSLVNDAELLNRVRKHTHTVLKLS